MPTWFVAIIVLVIIECAWELRHLRSQTTRIVEQLSTISNHLENMSGETEELSTISNYLENMRAEISSIEHEISLPRKEKEFEAERNAAARGFPASD
jgi:hypothetical protein